jgi:hypothetical protein
MMVFMGEWVELSIAACNKVKPPTTKILQGVFPILGGCS